MDFAEQLRLLQAAQGSPALLALATVDLAHHALPTAERMRIKDALLAAAVPHWCDRDFLAALLQTTPEESDRLLGQLRTLTVVEPFPARGEQAVNVHETARLALREHLRTSDASLWQALSARARAHVAQSQEPHARIEALYHLFATDQPAAATECEALDREFTDFGRPEVRQALALSLKELPTAGWLTGAAEVEALLSPLDVRNSRGETAQLETDARNLVALAQTAGHSSGIGRAQCLLGDALQTKGCRDEALVAFCEYLVIFQHLASADPSNAGWQRELAVARSKVGDVFQAQGRLDDALAAFREYLVIFQHFVSAAPSNAGWQCKLAVGHSRVGGIYEEQGRLNDALAAFRQYLAISQRIVSTDPSNADWQRELAVAHSRVGNIYQAQGRPDKALAALRESLTIFQRLSSADASNAGWQHDLAVAHFQLGLAFRGMGEEEQAQSSFRSAVETMEKAAAMSPGNVGWQEELDAMKSWLS